MPGSEKELKRPFDVKLSPVAAVRCKVVDESKKPVEGALVQIFFIERIPVGQGFGASYPHVANVLVGPDGEFNFASLIPDCEYVVVVGMNGYISFARDVRADAGQMYDLGEVKIQKADQSIAGAVVDKNGKPVTHVQVEASATSRGLYAFLGQKAGGTSKADSQGRFLITGVPRGMFRLAVREWRSRIGSDFPREISASAVVEAGRQNVRLIYDGASAEIATESILGMPAPEFRVSKWLNTKRSKASNDFSRENIKGKVILLAFMDESKPSERMLSHLKKLQENLAGKGLRIVRVVEAPKVGTEKNEKELAALSPTAAALVAPGAEPGTYSEACQKYGVRAMPALVLIDRQGIVRYTDLEPNDLIARCEELLWP